jgi:hypothetical protein
LTSVFQLGYEAIFIIALKQLSTSSGLICQVKRYSLGSSADSLIPPDSSIHRQVLFYAKVLT